MFTTTTHEELSGNPIDDVIGSAIKYAAITAGAKLGVFGILRSGPLTGAALAGRLEAGEQGVQVLCDTLVVLGYLEADGDRYANGPIARRWLAEGPNDFTPALLWAYELQDVLWDLPDAIRRGKPAVSLWERWADRPEAGRDFSAYMRIKSTLTVDDIVDAVSLPPNARSMVDLGGSHGLHSMAFARRHPELTATIVDLPEALANTPVAIEAAGLGDRVTTRTGDFLTDDIGAGYDVALVFEILHNHTPEENRALLRKTAAALNSGGRVVILEDVKGEHLDAHNAAFSLAMFACSGDRTYSLPEISEFLDQAGFHSVELLTLPSSVSLVVATKK